MPDAFDLKLVNNAPDEVVRRIRDLTSKLWVDTRDFLANFQKGQSNRWRGLWCTRYGEDSSRPGDCLIVTNNLP